MYRCYYGDRYVSIRCTTSSDSFSVSVPPSMEQSSSSRNISSDDILSVLTNKNVLQMTIK